MALTRQLTSSASLKGNGCREIRLLKEGALSREAVSFESNQLIPTDVKRPRNVDWKRAAAILYGDWGTSKAYVIGLAFAVAGYSSFWLIAAMCVLTALVGLNYMVICRLYPDGGGVYASVRHRSEVISIVGAFLLIADYLVTAAISALSAFQYLGVPHPEKFAAMSILIIGLLNLLGPKQTGGLAFLISVPTAVVVVILGLFCLPHLDEAFAHLQPLHGTFGQNWAAFVGIVLALSGVEAIANATGVMKLDAGSTDEKPSVVKTSTRPGPKACAITCSVTWAKFLSAARLVPRWVMHLVSSSALFSACCCCLPSTLRLSTSLQSNFSCHATARSRRSFSASTNGACQAPECCSLLSSQCCS